MELAVIFLIGWKAFFSNITSYLVESGSRSNRVNVISGVPQGSVLGPVFFIYFVNDTPSQIDCKIKLFADNTKIYTYSEDLKAFSKHQPNTLCYVLYELSYTEPDLARKQLN